MKAKDIITENERLNLIIQELESENSNLYKRIIELEEENKKLKKKRKFLWLFNI